MKIEKKCPSSFDVAPCRDVVGFVTSGDYIFSFATGGGIGFITTSALSSLYDLRRSSEWLHSFISKKLKANQALCLMRNIDSDLYRYAIIELL